MTTLDDYRSVFATDVRHVQDHRRTLAARRRGVADGINGRAADTTGCLRHAEVAAYETGYVEGAAVRERLNRTACR